MDMTSRIAFERAYAKANRLPEEERAIAPAGQVAYAHGVAAGEAKNREEAFSSDMAFREEAAGEKGRQFELSGAEQERQALTDLDRRYTQAITEMDERGRQFGGSLSFAGERSAKTLGESERQFGGRLTASGSQFDRRLAAEKEIFENRLNASAYESGRLFDQKMTQFEQEFAFKSQSFDEEMAWTREKFDKTLSFQDKVFADKMANERRQLDTWITSNRIGSVIQLANTAVSLYGMNKAITERTAMNDQIKADRYNAMVQNLNRGADASVNLMIDDVNNVFNTEKYAFDPKAIENGKFFIQDPTPQGTMHVSEPVTFSDFAKTYNKTKIPRVNQPHGSFFSWY